MKLPRPRVVANFAITADGKVTTRTHAPTTYTSSEDKQRLREIRAQADAVLAGAATVSADAMSMGLGSRRLREERVAKGLPPEPLRAILSASGRLDPKWKVFQHAGSPLVLFAGRTPSCAARLPDFCDIWVLPQKRLLPCALATLKEEYGVRKLVCEGGPRLFRLLLEMDSVDELYLTIVPRVFGGHMAPTLSGLPGSWLQPSLPFQFTSAKPRGGELHCRLIRKQKKQKNEPAGTASVDNGVRIS